MSMFVRELKSAQQIARERAGRVSRNGSEARTQAVRTAKQARLAAMEAALRQHVDATGRLPLLEGGAILRALSMKFDWCQSELAQHAERLGLWGKRAHHDVLRHYREATYGETAAMAEEGDDD